ncbi:MAG: hypothetical protein QOI73_674 [Solirubrobacteraceae bacterium]|nr:hypothetical protein [Solirubrobacteraceae bacterium]
MDASRRLTPILLTLTLTCAFCFGAIVKLAFADDYHVTCVGHGFVHGASQTDGSFFSRVESGCGAASRKCDIYVSGVFVGGYWVGNATCNAWSRDFGNYTECHATAHVQLVGAFADHVHKASNWCG